jgi:hypothetical protein
LPLAVLAPAGKNNSTGMKTGMKIKKTHQGG